MKVIAVTQKGSRKPENEERVVVGKTVLADGILVSEMDTGVLAIADGVGGQKAGAAASDFVANTLMELYDITAEKLGSINDALLKQSEDNITQTGMATTLSGICFQDGKAQLFSIGNTRVYLVQGSHYLKQLTTDDTLLQCLLSTGQLSAEDADNFQRKNVITACFGGGSQELFKVKVWDTDPVTAPVLLTSDGIHDYLTIDEMEQLFAQYGPCEAFCEAMIRLARDKGSCDDASVILGNIS